MFFRYMQSKMLQMFCILFYIDIETLKLWGNCLLIFL